MKNPIFCRSLIRLSALSAIVSLSIPRAATRIQAQAPAAAPATPAPAAAPTAPVLTAKFTNDFSTKNAKVGDMLVAKTVKILRFGDGVEIPPGSRITGKVVSVQSAKDGNGTAALGIKFDHVEMKGNREMAIAGLIVGIGSVGNAEGLGYDGILGRGGVGSTAGLDPSLGAGHGERDDIPLGSSLEGVALGKSLDAAGATQLRGFRHDIKIDPRVMIKVALFRPAAN